MKTTLIIGFDEGLALAAAEEAADRGRSVCLAVAGEPPAHAAKGRGARKAAEPEQAPAAPSRFPRLVFRPGSSFQARSLFLEAANAIGPLSEVVFCRGPARFSGPALGASPDQGERFADEAVRAAFQLLREAAAALRLSPLQPPRLAFLDASGSDSRDAEPAGLAALELDFLRALEDAALSESGEGLEVFSVSGGAEDPRSLAQALLKTLDDGATKAAGRRIRTGRSFLGRFA